MTEAIADAAGRGSCLSDERLRLVCGVPTPGVARLFLVSQPTMAVRLTRAKKKIQAAGIPYRMPAAHELRDRLPAALAVVALLLTEGHTASRSDDLRRSVPGAARTR